MTSTEGGAATNGDAASGLTFEVCKRIGGPAVTLGFLSLLPYIHVHHLKTQCLRLRG